MSSEDDRQPTRADGLEWPTMSSADRARFWAGLNRFLESEEAGGDDARTPEPTPVLRRAAKSHD